MMHRNVLSRPSEVITQTTYYEISVGDFSELAIDVNITALSAGATYQLMLDRMGADGVYYLGFTASGIVSAVGQSSTSYGSSGGLALGSFVRVREVITGATPSITRSLSIIGKG